MHITTVIPIARGIPFDTLSYYSTDLLAPGTLITVPLGRQTINAVVVESMTLLEAKTTIKQAAFSLKKIKSVIGHVPFFERTIMALQDTSAKTLTPIGSAAASVFPSLMFEYLSPEKIADLTEFPPRHSYEKKSVVGARATRLDEYKRLIRSAFAEKKSVLFVAPTIRDVTDWKETLEKGIGKHVVLLHSKVTKKDMRAHFAAIKRPERPLGIFATPGFGAVPRNDLGLIIAEDESSNLYKTSDRFNTDLRIFLDQYAERLAITIAWGDAMPRFETLEISGQTHLPRSYVPEKLHVVPIEPYKTTLPTEVIELVQHAYKKKRKLFIYTNRKGLAPLSRCVDCGTVVSCPECSLPMVLRNKVSASGERERYFMCTHCGTGLSSTHTCTYCNSWNIGMVSIGTESIRDEISSIIPPECVFTIDDDLTPDSATITKIISDVQKAKFAVVIGTVKVLPYLKNIHYTILPYFDRLLSVPSLYTNEECLRLVFECSERSTEGVILCTKQPDVRFITQLETQKINAIIFDELTLRKDLS